jgi:hypothetical protein
MIRHPGLSAAYNPFLYRVPQTSFATAKDATMADAQLVLSPLVRVTDANNEPIAGGQLRFFEAGTSSPLVVYSDAELQVALGSVVETDDGGYPISGGGAKTLIWTGPDEYKVVVHDADGVPVLTHDHIRGALVVPDTTAASYPKTPVVVRSTNTVIAADLDAYRGRLIDADPNVGAIAITLPSAIAADDGYRLGVRHAGAANTVTIKSIGAQTIRTIGQSSVTSFALTGMGHTVWLVSNGASWIVDTEVPALIDSPYFRVADRLTAPPVSPTPGARYIINGTPAGGWATLGFDEHDIVEFDGSGSWFRYAPADGYLAYVVDEEMLTQWRGTAWADLSNITAPNISKLKLAIFEHRESSGGGGGSSTVSTWANRVLNTTVVNTIAGVSINSSHVTLPVGTYLVTAAQKFSGVAATSGDNNAEIRARQRINPVTAVLSPSNFYGLSQEHTVFVAGGGVASFTAQSTCAPVDTFVLNVTTAGSITLQYYVNKGNQGLPSYDTTNHETYARLTILDLSSLQGPQGIQGIQGPPGESGSIDGLVYVPAANTAAAINASIAEAYGDGGGQVYLRAGDWIIDEPIVPRSGVHVSGEGFPTRLLVSTPTVVEQASGSQLHDTRLTDVLFEAEAGYEDAVVFDITSIQHSHISRIWGRGFTDPASVALRINSDEVTSYDVPGYEHYSNSVFNVFRDWYFDGIGTGIHLKGRYGSTPTGSPANSSNQPDIVITHNRYENLNFWGVQTKGIDVEGACDTEGFKNVFVKLTGNNSIGVHLASDATYTGNNYVSGMDFKSLILSVHGAPTGVEFIRLNWTFGNTFDIKHDVDISMVTVLNDIASQSHDIVTQRIYGTDNTKIERIIKGGSILHSDGSAALPSYSFRNDRNTGLYRVDNDVVGLTGNGVLGLMVGEYGPVVPTGRSLIFQDTNQSHVLLASFGTDITANRTLSILTGDANRTLNLAAIDGAWSSYTPTVSAGSGSITTSSATGKYRVVGKTTEVQIRIEITTNGTGASSVIASLPNTALNAATLVGRETTGSGVAVVGSIAASGTQVHITTFNNTYPGGNGYVIVINGTYENA